MKHIEKLLVEGNNEIKNNSYYDLTVLEMNTLKERFMDLSYKYDGDLYTTLLYFIPDVYDMGIGAGVRLERNRQKRNKKEKQPAL